MTTLSNAEKRARWQIPEGVALAAEVLERLKAGRSLSDLPLGMHKGRVDLRGISVPEVTKEELPPFRNWALHQLKGYLQFRNAHFENLDFSYSRLEHVQFSHSQIIGCRFDRADCQNWGIRASNIVSTAFIGAKLNDAVLGPWYQGRGNVYDAVDFSQADMRGVLSSTATYVDCDFLNAKLDKIDFQSSSFIRCRFAGVVREVIFYDNAFDPKKPDPNPMEDVDFSKATLRWVEFRRLNLDRVRLPRDENHLVVNNYRCVLDKAIALAAGMEDTRYRRSIDAILRHRLKWIGPQQDVGIFSRLDFRESGGPEGEEFAVALLRRAEQECSRLQSDSSLLA